MKKIVVFNFMVMLILFMLFSWQTYMAVLKYLTFDTRMSSTNIDDGSILFPSITVCKKYLNGLSEKSIADTGTTNQEKIDLVRNNLWNKTELFFFFSHNKMYNITFPCNTLDGATEQGKPCSFPFNDKDGNTHEKCSDFEDGSSSKFCYTRYLFT